MLRPLTLSGLLVAAGLGAQEPAPTRPKADSTVPEFAPVRVTAKSAPRTIGYLPDRHGSTLLVGKKTEVVLVDSMGANAAQNVQRQVLGRVPGLVVTETEGGGFPSNGIGVRGLNPTQSVEMNVRQNGVGVAADPFGYAETYYLPPLESVERVEIIRGSSGLQYGPQFGGVVNYVMRRGDPTRAAALTLQQTAGSYGLVNTFGSLGGGNGAVRWFGAAQNREQDGWRPNSGYRQTTAYATLGVTLTPTVDLTLDYSGLRNRIRMPGGLSDAQYAAGARQSFRARNWLRSPWNVASATLTWQPSRRTRLESVTSYLSSERSLVWRNEDVGPGTLDVIDPATGEYPAREVGRQAFANVTEELRLLTDYSIGGRSHTLAAGVRWFNGRLHRQGGGEGSTGSDFDLRIADGTRYEYDLRYATRNVAAWVENAFRVGSRLAVSPGIRVEALRSTAEGYKKAPFPPQVKSRTLPLLGIGGSLITSATTGMYANVSQAYRPIDYGFITPVGSVSRIDPNMRDPHGVNADLGWRGTLADDRVRFDVGVFRLDYRDRIGLRSRTDASGATYTERTNVANSIHQGLESYVEVTPVSGPAGRVTVFNSLALTDARYTSGDVRGHRVEYAPRTVERAGITLGAGRLSTTLIGSAISDAFGDADNTLRSDDAVVGRIPPYSVFDWAATLVGSRTWRLQAGVNNVLDRKYFTRRADEYPGPGIIPSAGRSVYATVRVGL